MNNDIDKKYRIKLYDQIQEQYGKMTYTYTCHLKEAHILEKRKNILEWSEIVLSSGLTGGILGNVFWDKLNLPIIFSLLSIFLLAINSYLKGSKLEEKITNHLQSAHALWKLREKYLSMMINYERQNPKDIEYRNKKLLIELDKIYATQLQTSNKAYKETQKALKNQEEQYFTQDELNKMLPKSLRK